MTRSGGVATTPFAQEILHDAVLGAVEADDGEPPARTQHALGGRQSLRQLVKLAVDVDADRLETLGCWILRRTRWMAQRLADNGGELTGANQAYNQGVQTLTALTAMTDAMKRHKVTGAYAFSATSPADGRPDLLRTFDHWVEAGHHIANHTQTMQRMIGLGMFNILTITSIIVKYLVAIIFY